jgi:hypothetical protein
MSLGDRDTSVGIATLYGLDSPGIESPGGEGRFSEPVQTGPGTQPASLLYIGYRVFPEGKRISQNVGISSRFH